MEVIRLSPSRISDYQQCPKLYHYRVIEKLPEPISLDAVRGTLIHNILEKLLGLSSEERTIENAKREVPVHWDILKNQIPELEQLVSSEKEWIDRANALLDSYFQLENPQTFTPTHMEAHLEFEAVSDHRGLQRL